MTLDEEGAGGHVDTIVVGGGTAGSAIAGLLAERSDESVLLLEAGPDYGPLAGRAWPPELLDTTALPTTHQWGYDSERTFADRVLPFERARVIGGCSSHNGCAEIWGSRHDYDAWAAAGNPGWSTDDLLPLFAAAAERLRVRGYEPEEVTPFQEAFLDVAPAVGIPVVDDLNDLDADVGIAPFPVNIVDGVRFNAAFAYLDPVRDRPNLEVRGDALVDRLVFDGDRVIGVVARVGGRAVTFRASRVVLAGGTYESPAVLLRSGVGPAAELAALGIEPELDLPGVGRNLHDHPAVSVRWAGTPELEERMRRFAQTRVCPEEQTIAKARTPDCREAFDLHLCPIGGPDPEGDGWRWSVLVGCMDPASRGTVRLRATDAGQLPLIDHAYLSDPDGHDLATLVAGVEVTRELARQSPLRELLGDELGPGAEATDAWVEATSVHYYHPVGTCKMGPGTDPDAVVDADGRVHGLAGVYVGDSAITPTIPRANTNLPALVIAQRIVQGLLGDGAGAVDHEKRSTHGN